MKRAISIILLFGIGGCSAADVVESTGESEEALNGDLVSPFGPLVFDGLPVGTHDETARRQNTGTYYWSQVTPTLGGQGYFFQVLATLPKFKTAFGFGSAQYPEYSISYYNKGDLGLGREMHCIDHSQDASDGQIACYVTNYSSGDDFGEFTFGLSRDIAFANMDAGHVLATVAMVFRPQAAVSEGNDQMLFMAFDAAGNLADNAPLDRHGISFANGFKAVNPDLPATIHFPPFNETGVNPDPEIFGTPGANLNNHIPSNCLNCHGGAFDPTKLGSIYGEGPKAPVVTNALFLPWDLEQLEFRSPSGPTTSEQTTLRNLNALARKVALSARGQVPMVDQIDLWYHNTTHGPILTGNFDPTQIPAAWSNPALHGDPEVYSKVIRPSCRSCHLTQDGALTFSTGDDLLNRGPSHVADIVASHFMPHALQTQREFWLSSQPVLLEKFLRQTAFPTKIPDAAGASLAGDHLAAGGPGRIVTLDPHAIAAAALF